MKTTKLSTLKALKTGVCLAALTGIFLSPCIAMGATPKSIPAQTTAQTTAKTTTQVEQNSQAQTAEKRKQIASEAVTALNETRVALAALDKGKPAEALAALEKATGKLELILARDPALALAPTSVAAVTFDVYGSVDDIKAATKKAEYKLTIGEVQEARAILKGLASETVISVTNLPLATYPAAIKDAVRLIDAAKIAEAKTVLQNALNTLVITDTVIPLPVVAAQQLLKEAETLAEKKDRSDADNQRLGTLLRDARAKFDLAQSLVYGSKSDFDIFKKELELIEDKTSDGKSGISFFEKIKESMTAMFNDSQHDKLNPQTVQN